MDMGNYIMALKGGASNVQKESSEFQPVHQAIS